MPAPLSIEITNFLCFLERLGMRERANSVLPMKSHIIEYADDQLGVRLHRDRGVWTVFVGEAMRDAWRWPSISLFTELFLREPEREMSLSEQVAFAETNWPRIAKAFSNWRRKRTYRDLIEVERARQRLQALRQR